MRGDTYGIDENVLERRPATRVALVSALSRIARNEAPDIDLVTLATRVQADFGAEEGDAAWAVHQALLALDKAVRWEPAITSAEVDANRFRDAARHIATIALQTSTVRRWHATLVEALQILAVLDSFESVAKAVAMLRRTPLAAPVSTLLVPQVIRRPDLSQPEPTHVPTVLLRFTLDDSPVSWPIALSPGRAYRLGVSATTDNWPEFAERLDVLLEGDVPESILERPTITLDRESERGNGYLIPKAEINPTDSVLLTPSAIFSGKDGARLKSNVIGDRTLRFTTFDPMVLGANMPMVAQRLVEMLAELDARIPSLPPQDRRNLFHLLDATARFAAVANERSELRGLDEPGFQAMLKQWFVADRFIGLRIKEAQKLGAGTTDLALERVVNELKVNREGTSIDDADRFVRLPVQYASAADCPVSVVTVLDDSPKTEPPGVLSNYMRWSYPRLHGIDNPAVPSMVAVVIVPIGFPVPSKWSKTTPTDVAHGN